MDCLRECEDREASLTLTTCVNVRISSTIIHRLSDINSWLIRQLVLPTVGWLVKILVESRELITSQDPCWSRSLLTVENWFPHQQTSLDRRLHQTEVTPRDWTTTMGHVSWRVSNWGVCKNGRAAGVTPKIWELKGENKGGEFFFFCLILSSRIFFVPFLF